jgi:AraC-like DNA-binding protein
MTLVIITVLFSALSCGIREGAGVIDLSGRWELIHGDDPAFAHDSRPVPAPEEIILPGYWPGAMNRNRDMTAYLWLRKKIQIDQSMAGDMLVLTLGRIAVCDETYFNGVKIGGEGRIPPKGSLLYEAAWLANRMYHVPASLVRAGGDNIIAVRVFSHMVTGMSGSPKLTAFGSWSRLSELMDDLPSMLNIGFFLLNSLLVALLLIIFSAQKRKKEFAFATALILMVALIHFLIFGIIRVNGFVLMKTLLGGILLGYLIFTLLVQYFFSVKIFSVPVAFSAASAATVAWIVIAPDSLHLMNWSAYAVLAVILAMITYCLILFIYSVIRDPYRFWPLIIITVSLVACCILIVAALYSSRVYEFYRYMVFQLPLALLGAMLIFLFDFKSVQKEKKSLTQVLMRTTQQLNRLKNGPARENVKPGPREVIYDVIEYLDMNYMESYNRKALAQRFNLNEDYIGQLFKKTTGTSISNYIYDRRIDAAALLVRDTNSKIIDIAYHVGFDNLTHFYRCFRKKTGMTPKDYRSEPA